ncbi:hypothetical protein MUK42_07528 [Musa troglodytarum]|uniref:Lipoxygenase n=1 Tax=Musa troglodytarum TaxID=320322 RepID=A0A9E7HA37_9LILI|nr:hypothetical protein MUK42_07528 [Musa troglodytarum]
MLTPQLNRHASSLLFCHGGPLPSGYGERPGPVLVRSKKTSKRCGVRSIRCAFTEVRSSQAETDAVLAIKAVATVKVTVGGLLGNLGLPRGIDDVKDLLGKTLLLELVSTELDAKTGLEKETVKAYAKKAKQHGDKIEYEATFKVPKDFGDIGGVFVVNEHRKEMFLEEIKLDASDHNVTATTLTITCKSWVQSQTTRTRDCSSSTRYICVCARAHTFELHGLMILNVLPSYLPAQTPAGLRRLREEELEVIRGDGQGERKAFERIYDYDVYNDLGDPDHDVSKPDLFLVVARSSRTRDAVGQAAEIKESDLLVQDIAIGASCGYSSIQTAIIDAKLGFPHFTAIDSLFGDGLTLPQRQGVGFFRGLLPRLVNAISGGTQELLRFDTPAMIEKFPRQTLAGVNPYAIELIKEFPLVSKLDPEVYGPPESAITEEKIEEEIKGVMTVQEAIENKRLFMLDYHDLLLPYVHKVRELEGTTLYGSRTIFFLTNDGTLRPLAIELTIPPLRRGPSGSRCSDLVGTQPGLGYGGMQSRMLRTHCCVEPYIIAAHRQLSEMHPIYRLLHPHFRYNMEINALARQALISGGGIIEISFSPPQYSMEISSVAYDQLWRFDMEALPADLIRRTHSRAWPAADRRRLPIRERRPSDLWVEDYVSHYYPDPNYITDDYELQRWWDEVRTEGHGDKKDEPWWPKLNTLESLIHALTTIIWVASAHHAAVNFGQYDFGGYFPNRPSIARTNMPTEDAQKESFVRFLRKPEVSLLQSLPSQIQATVVMAVLNLLSNHSVDEEYLGSELEAAWVKDPVIQRAYERFNGRIREIEGIIDSRNSDPKLKNRGGAGVVPYEVMKPFSKPGVTGMGIPNSISI